MNELFDYAVKCRRYLHENPETGFDLYNTVAFVCKELESAGIAYTKKFGQGSVVAELGPEGAEILAFRADMDALPVEEKTNLPFASKISGKMHACGHDSHTAILLAVAKALKAREQELHKKIRFLFQPSEECAVSGAKMMVRSGAMEGVSAVVGIHCENSLPTGTIGLHGGDYMAACAPITLEFFGKTSHATIPDGGVDAIAMAYRAYGQLQQIIKELAKGEDYIWSVGTFQGGTAHNVIADYCKMDISFRFYNKELCAQMEAATKEICEKIAAQFGGTYKLDWHISTYAVYNDPALTASFEKVMKAQGLEVVDMPKRMSSEDFAWYLTKAPGLLFRYGTGTKGHGRAHQNDFVIDEEGMKNAIRAFVTYALNG